MWVEMLWIPAFAGMTEKEAGMTEKLRLPHSLRSVRNDILGRWK